MSILIKARGQIEAMSAYHVTPHPATLILDANEAPYPPPQKLQEKLNILMAGTLLNRYPDMEASALRSAAARKEGVDKSEILFGNGSDDLIQILLATYCDPGDTILVPSPTFSMYSQGASFFSTNVIAVPLAEKFRYDANAISDAILKNSPKIIFIARPNNPTGGIFDKEAINKIASTTSGLVVIDEAYIDYCSEGEIGKLFNDHKNVVIMRTLSKVGFAALRLGYIMADASVIEQVNKVRQPFNVNSLTQVCGVEIFKNWKLLTPMFSEVISEREKMSDELTSIDGVIVYPSEANFLLVEINNDPEKVFNSLLEKNVRVRWFEGAPRLNNCFRVTIGSPSENRAFIMAFKNSL